MWVQGETLTPCHDTNTTDCSTRIVTVCICTRGEFSVTLYFQASDLKRHENNMHSERKQLNPLQSDTETLQAAAMAAEEQHLDNISCS